MTVQRSFDPTYIYLAAIVTLTIPLCINFFCSYLINAHDSMAGLIRALSMDKYMGHGQFLVRWSPGVNWGYGYPMFNFYPPLFSFISVLLFHIFHNMLLAINLACVLFWVLSGIGMFLFAREYWGNEGGMLSALLYVYAPYHVIDLYVRGAYAEFSSFAFFPFLLLSILKLSQKRSLGFFLLGTASVAGLSLTHNIMSMLFFPIAAVYMLVLSVSVKRPRLLLPAAGIFIFGLMISAFFWLPALIEKKFLNMTFLTFMRYDFHHSFITLGELFWPLNKTTVDSISFQIGTINTLLILGTIACLPKILKTDKKSGTVFFFFLIVGILGVFLTLSRSHLFWENISLLRFIQFPWRFLAIIVFAMSFLCGSLALLIKNPRARTVLLIMLGALIILTSLHSIPQPTFISNVQGIDDFLAMGEGEYTPKWVIIPPNNPPDRKFELSQGLGRLAEEKAIGPVHYETKFLALQPSLLFFNTFYFPGWQVYVDGQATEPHLDNPYGLILFHVPVGIHNIKVVFSSTPIRLIGTIISWTGLILLLSCIFYLKSKRFP